MACGALAKQLLAAFGAEVRSHVIQLGGIPDTPLELSWSEIAAIPDDAPLHCADDDAQQRMIELIDETRKKGDTLGGIFEVVARGVVPGLGSHTSWDLKLDGLLAQAVMSIPAVKAVAIGAGAEAKVVHHREDVIRAVGHWRRSQRQRRTRAREARRSEIGSAQRRQIKIATGSRSVAADHTQHAGQWTLVRVEVRRLRVDFRIRRARIQHVSEEWDRADLKDCGTVRWLELH